LIRSLVPAFGILSDQRNVVSHAREITDRDVSFALQVVAGL
jgi:hypothetical protein